MRERELVVVVMAGGAGTRFWPVSTEKRPKQFLSLFGPRSLFQESLQRVAGLTPSDHILIMTNQDFVPLVREQAPQVPANNIVSEPMRKDTAAAITLAALLTRRRYGDVMMAVLTADHILGPNDVFLRCLRSAITQADETGALYTFGIQPDHPATGYGYLELGERTHEEEGLEHFRLQSFQEKPNIATALRYLKSGTHLWNSGMFVWRVDRILMEIERQIPGHLTALSLALQYDQTDTWSEALKRAFESLPAISIDFAVMEGALDVRALAAPLSWKDLGGWLSVAEYLNLDESHNAHRGRIAALDSHANLVFCEDEKELVAMVGVDNLVVVRAGDMTLICPKGRAEEIKGLVKEIL